MQRSPDMPPPSRCMDQELPSIQEGQRLYICSGSPWEEALDDFLNPSEGATFDGWRIGRDYRKGDWILTYLETKPQAFLCWEQADHDATPTDKKIWVDPRMSVTFSNLVTVDVMKQRTGLEIRAGKYFEGRDADHIWQELMWQLREPRPWYDIAGAPPRVLY